MTHTARHPAVLLSPTVQNMNMKFTADLREAAVLTITGTTRTAASMKKHLQADTEE